MADGEATAIESEAATESRDDAEESESSQADGVRGNFLLPDVPLVLMFAIAIDILDVVFSIGTIVSLILGLPILAWMVWKTGKIQSAQEQVQRVRRKSQERAEFQQRQQQRLAERRAATRRAWRRGLLYFVGGLIPILNIFVLWTWAVITTVRGK